MPCSWIRRVDVKMTRLPKAICRFDVIPIKIPMAFSTKQQQIILKFAWNQKRPQIAKTILRQKTKGSGIMLQLQAVLNQNSMALAHKQLHRSVEQNGEPRNESTLL